MYIQNHMHTKWCAYKISDYHFLNIYNFKQSPGIWCTFFMQSQAKIKQNVFLSPAIQAISTNLKYSLASLEKLKQFFVISYNLLQTHEIAYNLVHSTAISCSSTLQSIIISCNFVQCGKILYKISLSLSPAIREF